MDSPETHRFQRAFWNSEAASARFSHPVNDDWLSRVVRPDAAILDYGCGYGRTLAELAGTGFSNLTGIDTSPGMIERARTLVPGAILEVVDRPPHPFEPSSFDVILLLAVLTAIPDDDQQRLILEETFRLLRPAGHLIVSDLPIQSDERRQTRYRDARPDGYPFGVFELEGGRAVMRHHARAWFDELFLSFEEIERREISVQTMRGHEGLVVQYLLRKPGA